MTQFVTINDRSLTDEQLFRRKLRTSHCHVSSLLEGIFWSELGARLARLDMTFLKKAWLDAARIIEEELVRVFQASRSILRREKEGGIEAVVRPRIARAIQEERYRLALLDQWIDENADSVEASTVTAMRWDITCAMEASLHRNPTEAAGAPAPAAEIISRAGLAADVRQSAVGVLAGAMTEDYFTETDPIAVEILEDLHAKLRDNPDYRGQARALFLSILYYTLLFLRSRENLTSSAVDGTAYLFNRSATEPPVEADLQRDYFHHLPATPLQKEADREVTGRGYGRADVFFKRSGYETVAELKKTHDDRTLAQLVQEFGLQTTAYQRTNITLCILMVLDLVDREGGSDHIRNLVDVFKKQPPSGQAVYSLAVFRVQGRKRPPSQL